MTAVATLNPRIAEYRSTAQEVAAMTSVELVTACQNGDKRAFEALLKAQQKTIYAILYKLAPDMPSMLEDMVQETNVRIYRSIHTLRNPHAFKRWLHQLITNLFYDNLRKKGPYICSLDEPIGNDPDDDTSPREIADTKHQPDEVLERREIVEAVNAAIETLPTQFKKVVVLRELHGLAYEEIARLTNAEVGTVKSRIARGRAKIQPILQPLRCA